LYIASVVGDNTQQRFTGQLNYNNWKSGTPAKVKVHTTTALTVVELFDGRVKTSKGKRS
jgi:hypothetical protein